MSNDSEISKYDLHQNLGIFVMNEEKRIRWKKRRRRIILWLLKNDSSSTEDNQPPLPILSPSLPSPFLPLCPSPESSSLRLSPTRGLQELLVTLVQIPEALFVRLPGFLQSLLDYYQHIPSSDSIGDLQNQPLTLDRSSSDISCQTMLEKSNVKKSKSTTVALSPKTLPITETSPPLLQSYSLPTLSLIINRLKTKQIPSRSTSPSRYDSDQLSTSEIGKSTELSKIKRHKYRKLNILITEAALIVEKGLEHDSSLRNRYTSLIVEIWQRAAQLAILLTPALSIFLTQEYFPGFVMSNVKRKRPTGATKRWKKKTSKTEEICRGCF
ncbi:hypothetical protein QAD02_018668 [Eretmocerus hayati]|uniref:Uncharacterized protein n=1 Tax=Eretmocerus hayati TaxID=131215 RepID=A0ACC2PIM0_9HYME|nr:hypothetical protein QAD02_018668 [Eretmocerus hayati]